MEHVSLEGGENAHRLREGLFLETLLSQRDHAWMERERERERCRINRSDTCCDQSRPAELPHTQTIMHSHNCWRGLRLTKTKAVAESNKTV